MATVILVRHGRTTATATGLLAGRTAGVRLDEVGSKQAEAAAERLSGLVLARVVTSPLERCRQTTKALTSRQGDPPTPIRDKGLTECDYGRWQGSKLKDLAKEALWKTVQSQPSAVTFPEGESLRAMQERGVSAVRRHDTQVEAEHGAGAVWVAVSHGDVIKSILADALGTHLDLFQRIQVDPASISIIRYTDSRPYVLAVNTHEGRLDWLKPPPAEEGDSDGDDGAEQGAQIGGGAGPLPAEPADASRTTP